MEQNPPSPLLSEIRALIAGSPNPVVLVAVPRWAALHLGRERAKELATHLTEGHADALRDNPDKKNNNGFCLLWLPVADHPHGGCFLLAARGYEAGLLIAWTDHHALLWPRSFTEHFGPLIAWRSDQDRWVNNPLVSEVESAKLTRAAVRMTRRMPVFVHPSPYLMKVINGAAPEQAAESPTQPDAP